MPKSNVTIPNENIHAADLETKGENADYGKVKIQIFKFIEEAMKNKVTGLSVCLVDGENKVFEKGFGYADKKQNISASQETVFRIGSITKLFTASAIMQLVEQGKADLDSPLQKYIPEFNPKSRFGDIDKITIRNLLTHHSGLPDLKLSGTASENPEPFQSMIDYMNDRHLAFPPNFIYSYSNIGFDLLGAVIERVSGMYYEDYIRDYLLDPLEMTNTSFKLDGNIRKLLSKGYGKCILRYDLPLRDIPAGGLFSNVSDLSHFVSMVLAKGKYNGKRILNESSVKAMMSLQNAHVKLDMGFKIGLCWFLGGFGLNYAGQVCSHAGGILHFKSLMLLLPDQNLGIIVLTNTFSGIPKMSKIASKTLQLALEAKNRLTKETAMVQHQAASVKNIGKDQLDITGQYATSQGMISIFKKNNTYFCKAYGFTFRMQKEKDNCLSPKYYFLGLFPINIRILRQSRISIKEIDGKTYFLYGQTVIGTEFAKRNIPAAWLKAAGTYKAVNLDKNEAKSKRNKIRIFIKDNILYIKEQNTFIGESLVLDPVSEDEAIILGIGRGTGETVYIKKENNRTYIDYRGIIYVGG